MKDMTQYECFCGRRSDVTHLKVVGCDANMYIPNELIKKYGSRSKKVHRHLGTVSLEKDAVCLIQNKEAS